MTYKPLSPAERLLWVVLLLVLGCSSVYATDNSGGRRGITIEDLVSIRDIHSITPSPDGEYVAFETVERRIEGNDFSVSWYIAATESGANAQRIATGGEPDIHEYSGDIYGSEIVWSPDSEWIYFTRKQNDAVQIWRASVGSDDAEQVTNNAGDILSLTMAGDGSKVYFTIGRTRQEIETIRERGARRGYREQGPPVYMLEFGAMIPQCTDGKERYQLGSEELACRTTQWVYDIQIGTSHEATEAELNSLPDQDDTMRMISRQGVQLHSVKRKMQKVSPDGARMAWIENANPKAYPGVFPPMVLSASVDGIEFRCPARECVDQEYVGFSGLWWRSDGREIIFKVNDGPHNSLSSFYGWTPGQDHVRVVLRNDDLFSNCELAGAQLICGWETWTSPKKIASINLENGEISVIIDVNPEFEKLEFTQVEKLLGKDDYGHEVYGHLVYPKNYTEGQAYPLIVTQYHSYGFLRGATGGEQPIHVYAQNGIAVLSFDHRTNQSESTMTIPYPESNITHFKNLHIRQGPASAIENMIDALVQRGIADPKRVGITGFSLGDQILSTALMRRNYAAATSAGPITVPVTVLLPKSSASGVAFNKIFGEPFSAKGREMRYTYSLEANADKIDTPVLIHAADRESFSVRPVYNALSDADKKVEMFVYPDELHRKWQPTHNYWVYRRNIDWFNFWLRDVEDPDPEKFDQYQRWRAFGGKRRARVDEEGAQ